MSTKWAVAKAQPDYAGELWGGPSAAKWPLASITLQIFLGFRHVHARGILHQVGSSAQQVCFSELMLSAQICSYFIDPHSTLDVNEGIHK